MTEEKVGNSLELTGTGEHFLNRTPSAQAVRSTINEWNLMKLKSFSMTKDTIIYRKQQATVWEKTFTNYTSDRGLISIQRTKTTKQSKQNKKPRKLDIKKAHNPVKAWVQILTERPQKMKH